MEERRQAEEKKNSDPDIVFQRVTRTISKREAVIPRHQHFSYEFIYLLSGKYEYQHNNARFKLGKNECVLIRPGDWHADFLSEGTDYAGVNLVAKTSKESDAILQADADESLLRRGDKGGKLRGVLRKMLAENSRMDALSPRILQALAAELFWETLRGLPKEALAKEMLEDDESIRFRERLQELFLSNINGSLSLEEIAAHWHMTPRTLDNHCRRTLRMSPVKAFLRAKMDCAMRLLSRTDMSIKEISEYLGFKNPYHFSKVFKRFFMSPPARFRKTRA